MPNRQFRLVGSVTPEVEGFMVGLRYAVSWLVWRKYQSWRCWQVFHSCSLQADRLSTMDVVKDELISHFSLLHKRLEELQVRMVAIRL